MHPPTQITVNGVTLIDPMEKPSSSSSKTLLAAMEFTGFNYEIECYVVDDNATFQHGRVDAAELLMPRNARGLDLLFWR